MKTEETTVPPEGGTIITPILQKRKLSLRERNLAQVLAKVTPGQTLSWDLPNSKAHALNRCPRATVIEVGGQV